MTDKLYMDAMVLAIREGRSARACGLSIDECPPFVNPDLSESWKMGWQREDDYRKGKADIYGFQIMKKKP